MRKKLLYRSNWTTREELRIAIVTRFDRSDLPHEAYPYRIRDEGDHSDHSGAVIKYDVL